MIYLSGNFVKFLQGHSLFGTDDVRGLCYGACCRLRELGLVPFTDLDLVEIRLGKAALTKLDLTRMIRFESQEDVRSFIRHCAASAVTRHKSGSTYEDGTLYWGKHSRRYGVKLYAKADELKVRGHGFSPKLGDYRLLLELYAQCTARLEYRIYQQELRRRHLDNAKDWSCGMAGEILDTFIDELQVADDMLGHDAVLDALGSRRALQAAYLAWREGRDVRAMTSRRTFYRWRSELLAAGGPDLLAPYSEAVDLSRRRICVRETLRSEICVVPEWAELFGLLYVPVPLQAVC
jgi:II/X family phage/plasmid replication protein